jgi:hypothetical protein
VLLTSILREESNDGLYCRLLLPWPLQLVHRRSHFHLFSLHVLRSCSRKLNPWYEFDSKFYEEIITLIFH